MTVFAISTGITLLLLAIAVIGLFAMMGELTARVGGHPDDPDDARVWPVEDARLGASPSTWPDELAHLASADTAVLLVLSPLCASCTRIAPTVAGHPTLADPAYDLALVVSCSSFESGADFLRQHDLVGVLPTALDVNGQWLIGELALNNSPAVLVFKQGQLASASNVASMAAIAAVTGEIAREQEEADETADRAKNKIRTGR